LTTLSSRAVTTVERAKVTCLRADLYMTLDQSNRAVAVGLDYLRHLGIDWSAHPTQEEAGQEYKRIWAQLGSRQIEDLVDLPLMSDPASLATLDVLTKLGPAAFFTDFTLHSLVVCRAINLSLEHGYSDGLCPHLEWLGAVAGACFDDYQAGFRFGQLGYDLVEKRGLKRFQARTYNNFAVQVLPWARHFKASRDLLRRAFEAASAIGDLTFAAFACANLNTNLLAAGDPLADVQVEIERSLAFAQKIRFGYAIDLVGMQLGLVRTLRGLTAKFGSFDDLQFDEQQLERRLTRNPELAPAESAYWIRKLQAHFTAGDYASAVEASCRAQKLVGAWQTAPETAEHHFYGALSQAAFYDSASSDERQPHLEALADHHRQLAVWAKNCPENFENRAALVSAEIARIEGRVLDAEHFYEKAIRSARANGFVQNVAVANELAGRFYGARGFEQIAQLYLRTARQCYLSWGAEGKVQQLDELYPHLRKEEPAPDARHTIGALIEDLDLATVLKISQAVSGEIVLEKLIDTLLRTAIEHAGAERGLLIVPRGTELRIQAEASASSVTLELRDVPISSAELPETVIQYAARTQDSLMLDDASARGSFSNDEYIHRTHARSILCLPLIKQGRLIAVLYLENNLAANVFTPARIAVLSVLVSAAAISLENSRLYHDLQEREAKIRRLVDANIVGVLISNLEGPIFEANDAFLQMVRYTREDVTSGRLRWTEMTPPEWRAVTERAVAQLRTTGTCEMYEKEYFRSDGSRVPVLVVGTVIGNSRSETLAFVLDLTERKRAEEERERLRQAQADLAYMSRVVTVGELAASLAHEIKQPITAAVMNAKTCARWLQRDEPNIAEACEAASRIVKDTTRAAEIIDRVRSLYRRGAPQRELVDINEIVREMTVLLHDEANRYSIPIRGELSPGLPKVMADRVQLQQVVMNLMLNGIEAMRDTGGELRITSKRTEDGQLMISVSDSGIGLPQEKPDRIFQAFFTTKAQGTGMGLSISRAIVESHSGRLWASSNTGRGATFHFSLPTEAKTAEMRKEGA
jgi:PAS domain S-box-containing protein